MTRHNAVVATILTTLLLISGFVVKAGENRDKYTQCRYIKSDQCPRVSFYDEDNHNVNCPVESLLLYEKTRSTMSNKNDFTSAIYFKVYAAHIIGTDITFWLDEKTFRHIKCAIELQQDFSDITGKTPR